MVFKGYAGFPLMKNKLKRYYGRRELHFITFSCYERRPLPVCESLHTSIRPGGYDVSRLFRPGMRIDLIPFEMVMM